MVKTTKLLTKNIKSSRRKGVNNLKTYFFLTLSHFYHPIKALLQHYKIIVTQLIKWKIDHFFRERAVGPAKCLNCNSLLLTLRLFMGRWKFCVSDWRGLGRGRERTKYLGCFYSHKRESVQKWNRRCSLWWLLQSSGIIKENYPSRNLLQPFHDRFPI